jgi:hypothetical protein
MKTHPIKTLMIAVIGAAAGLAGLMPAQAQETVTSGTVTQRIIHKPDIDPALAAQLEAVEQLPPLPADTITPDTSATFYSAQCPNWPPLPGNIFNLPLWDMGDGHYLVDDLSMDYSEDTTATTAISTVMAMSVQLSSGVSMNDLTQDGVPYLTIAPTGTNQLLITVINNGSPVNYELWWTPVLADPAYPWTAVAVGATGQTNFTVNIGSYPTGFYRAIWDTNGLPMWEAADPNNPGAGILAVFIDSPANGMTLN